MNKLSLRCLFMEYEPQEAKQKFPSEEAVTMARNQNSTINVYTVCINIERKPETRLNHLEGPVLL